jgi:DNA-binding cell septation regulator SpoVG
MRYAAGAAGRSTDTQLRIGARAAWGAPRDGVNRSERSRQAKLKKWTAHRSGALIGFVSVQLPSGMIVHDLRLMTGKNGYWIALPAMKQVDRDGRPRTDANGKAIFSPIIEFADRIASDRFRDLVIDVIRREHPEALAGGDQ